MEKNFKQKNFNNLVWAPLGSRVNIYIQFCLHVHFKVSAAWYCSNYLEWQEVTKRKVISGLKGTVSRDFLLLVFLWISFPPAPEYPIRIVSNFFENSRRYSQAKVHHRCQRHRWQIASSSLCVVDTGVNDGGGKLPPVSMTPPANLPPVSLTPVANNGINIRLQTS
jgi:hypothetical protein